MRLLLLTIPMTCSLLTGCGGAEGTSTRLPVFPINGTIMYKGKPVVGADVTFMCTEKDKSAFGRTDEHGNFKLTTYASNDGAVAGKHVVTIMKLTPVPITSTVGPEDPRYDPFLVDKIPPRPAVAKAEFPAKYSDPKKSDLIVVVNDDGSNAEMKLDLKD